MIPYLLPKYAHMTHEGMAVKPTNTQTLVAFPLKAGVCSAIATINVPVTI